MSTSASIRQKLGEYTGQIVEPNIYKGTEKTYLIYRIDTLPEGFAEGTAVGVRAVVTVDLFMPHGKSPAKLKKQVRDALQQAGTTYPSIVNASDSGGQHYVFECEAVNDDG